MPVAPIISRWPGSSGASLANNVAGPASGFGVGETERAALVGGEGVIEHLDAGHLRAERFGQGFRV